jgi:hypothetical protein
VVLSTTLSRPRPGPQKAPGREITKHHHRGHGGQKPNKTLYPKTRHNRAEGQEPKNRSRCVPQDATHPAEGHQRATSTTR